MNIDSEYKFDDLTLIRHLKNVESPFLPKISEVYEGIKDILNSRVQYVFPNYTLHNTGHSFRLIEYMSKLVDDYTCLNELEVSLLIYSALLHDIGMAVSDEDVDSIKSDSFAYCEVKFSAMKKLMGNKEDLALQEYVRRIHGTLSGRFVREHLKDKLTIPKLTSLDFANELASICESHTQEHDWIKTHLRTNEVRGDYYFNSQFVASILRIADLLDIDANRTPYNLYKMISPRGESGEEWKKHFVISNTEKIATNDITKQKKIVFHGKATSASVHRKILVYIGWVEQELTSATALVKGMQAPYSMVYETTPEVNIQTEGYTFSDYKMTLEFKAISSLLMGEKIYGSKSLGLRELIQNSIDSCRIRQESEAIHDEYGREMYQPKIKVILDSEKDQVIIKDNGTGMSLSVIKKHFLNIGVSYYTSKDFLLRDYEYKPIGNFGIGFLSCFMLSDDVKVITRHYKSKNKYLIELEKGNEYTSLTESEDVVFDGTEVALNYTNFISAFEKNPGSLTVKELLEQYFLTDGIELVLIDKPKKETLRIENSIAPEASLEKGLLKIDLREYLNDIEGYALIKSRLSFIKKFEEINFEGELYRYVEGVGLEIIDDCSDFQIDDYISDYKIRYFSIPLVESENEENYLNGMKFTGDDVDEVVEKMNRDLRWISIIIPKESDHYLFDQTFSEDDSIYGICAFQDLVEIGHSEACTTKIFIKTISLFEGRRNKMYMPFDLASPRDHWYRPYEKGKELFMRGVLLRDFIFIIPVVASIFEITKLVVNINSRKFIPDISRNNVDKKERDIINYVIGKAIHIGAIEALDLQVDEKDTLEKFIGKYYGDTTDHELSASL